MAKVNFLDSDLTNSGSVLTPFQRKLLIKRLQTELRPEYQRRIEIMLLADQGYSQTQICDRLSCCHETARYWIAIARAGQAHLWNETQIGRPKTVNEFYLNRLKELVTHSPREYGYPFQRWTAQWLKKHLAKETSIEVTEQHINRLLRSMGLSTRSSKAESAQSSSNTPNEARIRIQDLSTGECSNSTASLQHVLIDSY